MKDWWVYIIRCSDNSYYTGIATDPQRRFAEHANGRGAKYFRSRKPQQIVFQEGGYDRSAASKREWQIKALTRQEKELLVDSKHSPD